MDHKTRITDQCDERQLIDLSRLSASSPVTCTADPLRKSRWLTPPLAAADCASVKTNVITVVERTALLSELRLEYLDQRTLGRGGATLRRSTTLLAFRSSFHFSSTPDPHNQPEIT